MINHKNVAVIVLTHDDYEETLVCLEHIHKQDDFPYRIVVCDNGSAEGYAEKILEEWSKIAKKYKQPLPKVVFGDGSSTDTLVLLRRSENLGAPGGINAALRLLLQDPVCKAFWLLHNDSIPSNFALRALIDHANESIDNKNMGMVGSSILYEDSNIQECAAGGYWKRWSADKQLVDEGMERYVHTDWKDVIKELDFINGSSCLLTRKLVETIGLFDERFFFFFEDVEYGLRAKEAGFVLNWAPGSVVSHKSPHSADLTPVMALKDTPELSPYADYLYTRNRFYLLRRERPSGIVFALFGLVFSHLFFSHKNTSLKRSWGAAMDGIKKRMTKHIEFTRTLQKNM